MPFASATSKSTIHCMPLSTTIVSSPVPVGGACGSGPTATGFSMSCPRTAMTGWPPDCTIAIQRSGRRRARGARRHDACSSSPTTADLRKRRRMRQRLVRRRGRGRTLRLVRGLERMENPRGALVAEAIGELPPGGLLRFDVVARAPQRLPRMHAPVALAAREVPLVRIEMDLVRVDPHAKLGAPAGLREEPRFQSHRQEGDRLVARAQPFLHRRRQRPVGAWQREARSEQVRRARSVYE